jgi:Fe2+ transport system protein A
MEPVDLTQFEAGRPARVKELQGMHEVVGKLQAMGIIPGTVIYKKSVSPKHGPVIIVKGKMQIAVGLDMAKGILVEPLD